jgi:hypothetical protein
LIWHKILIQEQVERSTRLADERVARRCAWVVITSRQLAALPMTIMVLG